MIDYYRKYWVNYCMHFSSILNIANKINLKVEAGIDICSLSLVFFQYFTDHRGFC